MGLPSRGADLSTGPLRISFASAQAIPIAYFTFVPRGDTHRARLQGNAAHSDFLRFDAGEKSRLWCSISFVGFPSRKPLPKHPRSQSVSFSEQVFPCFNLHEKRDRTTFRHSALDGFPVPPAPAFQKKRESFNTNLATSDANFLCVIFLWFAQFLYVIPLRC